MVLTSLFHICSQGNKALYKPCATWRGEFEGAVAVFLCNDGDGHRLVVNFIPDALSWRVILQQGCFQRHPSVIVTVIVISKSSNISRSGASLFTSEMTGSNKNTLDSVRFR